jgi:hypothetical protein
VPSASQDSRPTASYPADTTDEMKNGGAARATRSRV